MFNIVRFEEEVISKYHCVDSCNQSIEQELERHLR